MAGRPTRGRCDAPVMIVCDAPTKAAMGEGLPMELRQMKWVAPLFEREGVSPKSDVFMVGLCPPVPEDAKNSASRKWKHVEPFVEGLTNLIDDGRPSLIVTLGELASRAVLGRAVKITKARGQVVVRDGSPPVFPMLSPGFVDRIPDHRATFEADVHTVGMLSRAGFDPDQVQRTETHYEWRTDISDLLGENKPATIAVDTEGTGLRWWDENVELISVQISTGPGHAVVCLVDAVYWKRWLEDDLGKCTKAKIRRLVSQLKELLEDPDVNKIGQNHKFDHHHIRKLGIEVQSWLHDTNIMGFAVDENMLSLGLDELTRVYVPEMSGYADDFNRTYDKSDMRSVPPDDFLLYAGGDPDATFRLARVLQGRMRMDPPQQRVYRKIQMPATACFMNVSEPYGLRVDVDHLRDFGEEVREWLIDEYRELIRMVPARVRRKHLNAGKDCSFGRAEFVQDVLFGVDGFGLEPRVWTKGTMDLQNVSERVASTSAKDHMPYFVNETRMVRDGVTVGDFVTRLIEFKKTVSLESHFIGREMDPKKEHPTGLWKYLSPTGFIHPSFGVTIANTGRTNTRDPNSQNFPKRGTRFAKVFGRIFIPRDGYVFVACDLSQIELRVAAWMAGERTMLQVFRENGDIHAKTAAACMGITLDEFNRLDEDERKLKRFQAKPVNFGFLYGQWWRGFMQYAKVEYGVDFTEDEAKSFREAFFETYDCIEPWHNTMKDFAHEHGYVAALHGAVRHLPMIKSRDEGMMRQAERYAINSPVQRFGSDLGLIAFIRFSQRADPELMRVVNFIHDQTFLEAREDYAEEAASALRWCMQNPPLEEWFGITSPVPITSDVEMGENAGAMEEVDIEARRPEWW